jgi:hypothetical protein
MKLGYTKGSHYWIHFYTYLAKLMGSNIQVVNSTQCDVFFYTFWNVKDAKKCRPNTRLVFISGECWDTSTMKCSLLIDCKHVHHTGGKSFMYYPFYVLSFFERSSNISGQHLIKPPQYSAADQLRRKTKFCAFMYSYDVDFRVKLFDDISSYKRVDALGKSRNPNPHASDDRKSKQFMDSAVNKYKPYKFVICCENKRHPGYVTEKIINAMLADSIPIYYGASDISSHFNPKSFIDIGSFATRQQAIDYIKRVDQDDVLYCSILKEPWFTNNTPTKFFDSSYVAQFFKSIKSNSPKRRSHSISHSPLSRARMKQKFTTLKQPISHKSVRLQYKQQNSSTIVQSPIRRTSRSPQRTIRMNNLRNRTLRSRSRSRSPLIRRVRFTNRRKVGPLRI